MPEIYRMTRIANLESLCDFRDFLKAICADRPDVTKGCLHALQLAVDEACANIITHGYENMDPGAIVMDVELDPACLRIHLTDFGHPFEPGNVSAPDVRLPIEERKTGGLGLYFIQQSVDLMEYQATENGNTMVLTKYLPAGKNDELENNH